MRAEFGRMMLLFSLSLFATALVLTTPTARADGPPAAKKKSQVALSPSDRTLLERLTKEFVFDPPADAVFVAEPTMMRTVWGSQKVVVRNGWRVAGKIGQPDHVYFTDGDNVSLPKQITLLPVDYVAACRERYTAKPKTPNPADPNYRSAFQRMPRDAIGDFDTPPLVDAVWLHKLGHDDLAQLALRQAEKDAETSSNSSDRKISIVDATKHTLATIAFLQMVHAFMVNADDEAERHGRRLLKLYPREAKQVGQTAEVLADLDRRKKKGTFGKSGPPIPPGFDSWETTKRIAWLIDSLDEVQQFQMMQPGAVMLAMDSRVMSLIGIGNPAVPALIDTIERDTRLTRSVHFWRDFAPQREVLGVREAALTAAMSILKIQAFQVNASGDSFTVRGAGEAKRVAARLRKYWTEYGGLSIDERMMKTLVDPHSSPKAAQQAAENLAALGNNSQRYFSPSGERLTVGPIGPERHEPNPAVKKFSNPTAAEAILVAMDRDLAAHEKNRGDQLFEYDQDKIEDAYLNPLTRLGDRRIAPELARRYAASSRVRLRRKLALAASRLGDSQPMKQFIADFEAGRLTIPKNGDPNLNEEDQPGTVELRGIITSLIESHLPEADAALFATADSKSPYHRQIDEQIHKSPSGFGPTSFRQHPFCLLFFRHDLDDTTPSGVTYEIKGVEYNRKGKDFSNGTNVPDFLADPSARQSAANGRKCDDAADAISSLALGVPMTSPLLHDADRRIARMKEVLDRLGTHFRVLSQSEMTALEVPAFRDEVVFVPVVEPLGRPATADDVAKGRAIFELGGHGKLAAQKLPAVATLAGDKKPAPQKVLILQAEIGPDGKAVYGIVGFGLLRSATAEELSGIKPVQ